MAGKPRLDRQKLRDLCDGERTYQEIADILGWKLKTVKSLALKLDLPRRKMGHRKASRLGKNNPAFQHGRRIATCGYVYVTAPLNHPNASVRKGRSYGRMLEHRLVIEKKIGRYLEKNEVVDHIDGLTIHNAPENLRIFDKNSEHLRETLNSKPAWSASGWGRMNQSHPLRKDSEPVDIHRLRRKRGDVRLRQMILAALKLGIDSPYLLGTHAHFQKAGIDCSQRSSLELALAQLLSRYEQDLLK